MYERRFRCNVKCKFSVRHEFYVNDIIDIHLLQSKKIPLDISIDHLLGENGAVEDKLCIIA